MVEPDLVDENTLRLDAEEPRELPLEPDRDVAQTDRAMTGVQQRPGDDADRVREVDDPRAVRGPLARAFGDFEHYRHRAHRLREPTAPVVSCPMQPHASGIVSSRGRAAWPPTRICTSTKSAPSIARVEVAREQEVAVESLPVVDPRRHPAHDLEPLRVDVLQRQLADAEPFLLP